MRGAGGHGSAPYLARDPVPALAGAVTALQTMTTRRFNSVTAEIDFAPGYPVTINQPEHAALVANTAARGLAHSLRGDSLCAHCKLQEFDIPCQLP